MTTMNRSLSRQAPAYLTDDINHAADSGRRLLRSCVIPCTHNTYRDKSFTAAGSRVWTSYLQRDISYRLFERKLKTFLCRR